MVRLAGEVRYVYTIGDGEVIRTGENVWIDAHTYALQLRQRPLHSVADFVPPQESPRLCAPRYIPHANEMYAHEVHAYEMHAHEVHVYEMHAREVTAMRHTPMRCTPVRYTPMRHPPIRCTLVGCMPVRYVLIFENGFVVLDAEPGLAVIARAGEHDPDQQADGGSGAHPGREPWGALSDGLP